MYADLPWWKELEPQWKQAFAETFFGHTNEPTQNELAHLYQVPAIRLAGPSAPYPNMSFGLTNLSGIMTLNNLEILVATDHQIETIRELESLPGLCSLFLYNNKIKSLEGIEELIKLSQLYVQSNKIASILPVQKLVNLKEFYINDNRITSLEGLTEEHADKLERFFCKPNQGLKQREILRIEKELGIRCRGL
ncbi:MAG: leucine-rich repeat domain-containing protein [Ginsengibacter sp.]